MSLPGLLPRNIFKKSSSAAYSILKRNAEKPTLIIIGGRGAIGTPASYLAVRKQLRVIVIDDGLSAFDNSTHTVHTSIVRPNKAIWPFMQALRSWRQGGPLDIRLSPSIIPFCWRAFLQSYLVRDKTIRGMWQACRSLAFESQKMYAEIEADLGPLKLGGLGRAHLSSPMIPSDRDIVLNLRAKLDAFGVESDVVEDARQIQSYVGDLVVRAPEVMVKYPEDFVLDLHKYKSRIFRKVIDNGGMFLNERAVGLDIGGNGRVNAVLTDKGNRVESDFVLCTGGWRIKEFLNASIGLNLNGDLTVAAGVRFRLPQKMVNRSVVCGPMFLAPGRGADGNECTDIGQMFLINFEDTVTHQKHVLQAIDRFHTYFDYQKDIGRVWNCVGRPITPSGMPFVEKVSPNMVVSLGAGMFGATIGPGLANRSLDLLCDDVEHPYHSAFGRQRTWDIALAYVQNLMPTQKAIAVDRGAESPEDHGANMPQPRVIQIGRRGSMTKAITQNLSGPFQVSVFGASDVQGVLSEMRNSPESVILVASHGSRANLPPHYDTDYIRAEDILERVLLEDTAANLTGVVVISGGLDPSRLQHLMAKAKQRRVRFVALPSLATSMETLFHASRGLLEKSKTPRAIFVEDIFHRGKKEVPSMGSIQIVKEIGDSIGWSRLLLVTTDELARMELMRRYPLSRVVLETNHDRLEEYYNGNFDFIPVILKSQRLASGYVYAHRLIFRGDNTQIILEQRVTERDKLIPPLKAVLDTLPRLPQDFTGTGISSVTPFVSCDIAGSSLEQMVASIIEALAKSKSITSVYLPKDNSRFQGILPEKFLDMVPEERIRWVPTTSSLEIHSLVDSQTFQIGIELDHSRSASFSAFAQYH
jgi:glycine/D-amino acid oxidase-like deaminating enzyme